MDYQDIRDILTEYFQTARTQVKARIAKHGQLTGSDKAALQNGYDFAEQAVNDDDFYFVGTGDDIETLLKNTDLSATRNSPDYELIRTEYVKAYRDYCKDTLAYNESLDNYDFSSPKQPRPNKNEVKQVKLSDAINEYIEEKTRLGDWREKTANGFRANLELLSEYVGADALIHISSDTANDVKRMLMSIPQYSRSKSIFLDMSLEELMKLEGHKRMSKASIAKYIQAYSAFYTWAVKRQNTDENNFENLRVKVDKGQQERDEFSNEQIQLIINEVIKDKGLVKNASQKWGILIALYTGARLTEIAQMTLDDIKEIEGIWCFDINADGTRKQLKNKSSKRIIPVHSHLLKLGILDHIKDAKNNKKERLLHHLTYHKKNGYGRNLSRWFNESFLTKMGLKTDRLVFHSFRHTVPTRLLQANAETAIVKTITGHAIDGVLHDVYAKGYTTQQLKDTIELLDYQV